MQQQQSFKSDWKRQIFFVVMLTLLPVQASAFQLTPTLIEGFEGTSFALVLTYEASDWRVPNQEWLDTCAADGFPAATWVAQFQLEGVSDSADFSNDSLTGDLHYTHNGSAQVSPLSYYRCDESVSNPGEQVSNNFTLELNDDEFSEGEEFAEFLIYDKDFDDTLTFHDSIDVYILDTDTNHGVLDICCDYVVSESDSMATVIVSRTGGAEGAISVDYLTGAFDQTATSGLDYVNTFGTLNWVDGDASDRFIDIPIIDDSEYEGVEYFWVDIVNPMGGATLDPDFFFVGIDIDDNDEPGGTVMINSFSASPSTIDTHDTTTLSWSVSNATQCTPTGGTAGWSETSISLPSGSVQLTLTKAGSFVFGLSCIDDFSSDIANTTVEVIGPPPVVIDSFTATPDTLDPGQSATLSWTVSNAESCTAVGGTGGWAGSTISLPSGSTLISFPEAGEFVFELNCSNSASAVLEDVMVTVTAPPEVSIDSFIASPNPVAEGGSTTLSWSVSNAESCTASDGAGGWAGSLISLPSGSLSVTPPTTGDFIFTLNCSNSFGSSDTAMVTVLVEANPSVLINSFSASPDLVDEGQSTELSWTVSNADSCEATGGAGGWAGSLIALPSGSQLVTLSTVGSVTFTLTCSNSFESSDTATVTVTVAAPETVVIGSFTASPNPIDEGQSTTLSWSVSNADSCTASGGAGNWAGSAISLPSGDQTVTLATAGSYTFTLQCSNASASSDSADATVTVQADTEPDLATSEVTADKTTLMSDGALMLSATITNVGTSAAGASTVRYYLSTNNIIEASDSLLGTSASPALDAAANQVVDLQTVLTATPGSYWLGACVDAVTDESNEANNCSTGPQITVESDSNGDCTPLPIACGETLSGTLNAAECMSGPLGANHYAQSFTVSGGIGDPLFIDAQWGAGLDGYLLLQAPSGLTVAENDNYTASSDSHIEYQVKKNGTHTIWATSNEPGDNGSYSMSLTCSSPPGPDLTLSLPVLDGSSLISGQNISVSTSVHNVGDSSSDSTNLRYMLSTDATIDQKDAALGTERAPGLASGSSADSQLLVRAPYAAGNYYIGVCADPVADESSVSNNCSAGKFFRVDPRQECSRRALACGQSRSETLNADDCTSSPRGNGYLAEFLEFDAVSGTPLVIDADWIGLDGYLLLQAPNGEVVAEDNDAGSAALSQIDYLANEDGTYTLWATSSGRVETGSYAVDLTCGSISAPDLVASQVLVDKPLATINDSIELTASVSNQGASDSAGSIVRFILSRDIGISSEDEELSQVSLASLPVGGESTINIIIEPLTSPGNYWIGMCVDPVEGEALIRNNCSQLSQATAQSSAESGTRAKDKSQIEEVSDLAVFLTSLFDIEPIGTLVIVSENLDCDAVSLSCGQSLSGTLADLDCDQSPRGAGYWTDPFFFEGVAGDVVSLNAAWTGVDGYLYLQGPDDSVIGENDDFQDVNHSRHEYVLESSGTYQGWVTSYDQGQSGSYDLSLECNSPTAPDLMVEQPQVNTSTARPGQSVMITTTASNQGNEPADATVLEFILADSSILEANDPILGTIDIAALSGGAGGEQSLMAPLNVTPGAYWIGACIRADVMEINTVNNCDVTGPITVEESSDVIPINTGLNDAWFNPETAGQGFFINVFPDSDIVFLSWFTFDTELPNSSVPFELGDPGQRWLTAQGTYDRGVATLNISLTAGGVFNANDPSAVTDPNSYGTMTVIFSDCNNGVIDFNIPSINQFDSIPITRVADDNVTECANQIGAIASEGDVTAQNAAASGGSIESAGVVSTIEGASSGSDFGLSQGFSDGWYNPETDGQGFFVNVFPEIGQVFLSWFTYDTFRPAGNVTANLGEPGHRWITAQGSYDGERAVLTVNNTSGGIFNSDDPLPMTLEYGTITVEFADCNSGTIAYSLSGGLTGVVPIQRIARDSVPGCEIKSDAADDTLGLSPSKGDVLENLCDGALQWNFDWPDDPRASTYDFRMFRNDNLGFTLEATYLSTEVKESELSHEKLGEVPDVHREGWLWQARSRYTGFEDLGSWSTPQTFDVKTTANPCVD